MSVMSNRAKAQAPVFMSQCSLCWNEKSSLNFNKKKEKNSKHNTVKSSDHESLWAQCFPSIRFLLVWWIMASARWTKHCKALHGAWWTLFSKSQAANEDQTQCMLYDRGILILTEM